MTRSVTFMTAALIWMPTVLLGGAGSPTATKSAGSQNPRAPIAATGQNLSSDTLWIVVVYKEKSTEIDFVYAQLCTAPMRPKKGAESRNECFGYLMDYDELKEQLTTTKENKRPIAKANLPAVEDRLRKGPRTKEGITVVDLRHRKEEDQLLMLVAERMFLAGRKPVRPRRLFSTDANASERGLFGAICRFEDRSPLIYRRNTIVEELGSEVSRRELEEQMKAPGFMPFRELFGEGVYPLMAELRDKFDQDVPVTDLANYRKKVIELANRLTETALANGLDLSKGKEDQPMDRLEVFNRISAMVHDLKELDAYWRDLQRLERTLWMK